MIPETVVLAFNPETTEEEVKAVFADDMARTLWLAVKRSHMTSQNFSGDCLQYARLIERAKKNGPLAARQLLNILSGILAPPGHGIIGSNELDFAVELLPFVNGEKVLGFTVKVKQQSEEEAYIERAAGLGPGKAG